MYTQCPSCRTMFRISEQQLAIAKGKVRCGKCNHIYNAQGTLIDQLPQQAPVTPPVSKPQPVTEDSEVFDVATTTDDDDWLFDENDEFGSDELPEEDIPSITHPQEVAQEDWQMANLGSESDIKDQHYDDEDDDWLFGDEDDDDIDIILREEGDEIPAVVPPQQPAPSSLPDANDEEDSDFMRHMSDYLDEDKADEIISDESAAGILDELNEQLSFEEATPKIETKQNKQGINTPADWFDDFDEAIKSSDDDDDDKEKQEINDAILNNLDQPAGTTYQAKKEPVPELATEPLTDNPFVEKESIVLEAASDLDIGHKIGQHDEVPLRIRDSIGIEEQEPRSGLKWLAISGSITGLIILLIAQAVLFRSADLAYMYPEFKPTLISLCENLPCRDSRKYDVHEIELMSRNVNQHPKTKSALLIKAAIINRAKFAQRYPKIQITLSDVTGDTVAQRIFYPQEYLGKLFNPFLQMKPNTPVHIALEVMDPGSTAINFEFKFL